jgi:hypothetical protein
MTFLTAESDWAIYGMFILMSAKCLRHSDECDGAEKERPDAHGASAKKADWRRVEDRGGK